ncbi:hypothetical protein BS47DRAFT_1314197, partial [Hydnum rufescens UP504]
MAQWIDEDDLDEMAEHSEPEPATKSKSGNAVKLASLPFGTLASASRALEPRHHSDDDLDSDEDSDEERKVPHLGDPSSSRPTAPKKLKVKRPDKHAPMEITSKKPVSRRRTIIDVPKIEQRDPRFSTLSGEFNPNKFAHSYSFVTDMQQDEVASLRKSLALARKLSQSSPAHLREERAAEVTRLERALKRTESAVERAKREKRDREVLGNAKREERKKRETGKTGWFMKTGEKRELLAKARFEELAAVGGKQAVNKAITKRKLKLNQKEKRSRPDSGS